MNNDQDNSPESNESIEPESAQQLGEAVSTVETVAPKVKKTIKPVKPNSVTKATIAKRRKKKSMGESKTSPRRIKAVEEKQAQALEYRKMGYSYAMIAESLGYATAQGAYCAIQSALTRIIREPAQEVLTLELERLDAMFAKPYQAACAGDLMAINSCLGIMARKARYLGLDAPAKVDSTIANKDGKPLVTQTVSKEEIAAAIAEAAARF